jgi:oligopeptide transport system substrate-binding protein
MAFCRSFGTIRNESRWAVNYPIRIACVASLVFCLGACAPQFEPGVLRLGIGAEPQALDPFRVTGHTEHLVMTGLFEGLTTLHQKTLEVEPGMAESWTVSDDGLVYTFRIHPGAKWSNGDPVTAHDFVWSWMRHLSPNLASEYSYMLWCLKNAEAYNKGEITDFTLVGAKALDDRTLECTLVHPAPYFLSMQIHYAWFPVHRASIEACGAYDDRNNVTWTRPGKLVSNGPFMLVDWKENQIIRLRPNPYYCYADDIKLAGVDCYPIDDVYTEVREFKAGKLHVTETIPFTRIEALRRNMPESLHIDPMVGTYFYRMNVTRKPLDDPRVRRALAMAIDRESLCNDVLHGVVKPATAFTPPGLAGYTAEAGIPYDPEQARRLLAEAGYPDGKGFPPIEILFNSSEDHKLIAEAIQNMWQETLNVRAGTNNQEWKVYLSSLTTLDYDVARSAWIADFLDPINYLECFIADGGNNRTGWSSPEFDALIEKARRTAEPGERFATLQQAERILLEAAPIGPIYSYTQRHLISPQVSGLDENMLGYLNYKHFWVESAVDPRKKLARSVP